MSDEYNRDDLETLIRQRDTLDQQIHDRQLQGALGRAKQGSPAPAPAGEDTGFEVIDDNEPDEPMVGAGLSAQNFMDDMEGSMAPEPEGEGGYVWDHNEQRYVPDDRNVALGRVGVDDDGSSTDLGRGAAFTDAIGNNFYTPYGGHGAGKSYPIPEGIGGRDLENYQDAAEFDEVGREAEGDALLMALQDAASKNDKYRVEVGKPQIHKAPQIDVEVGTPVIMPREEELMAPDQPARKRRY